MAFAPQNPTAATLILFICIIAWGSYAPLRRTSNNIQGDIFGTVAFIDTNKKNCKYKKSKNKK